LGEGINSQVNQLRYAIERTIASVKTGRILHTACRVRSHPSNERFNTVVAVCF